MIYRYLLEFKYRILFSFVAWSFMMLNCYYFKETLLYIFMKLGSNSKGDNLIFFLTTDVAEVFIAYIHLSFYISNQIIILFLLYQIFFYLSPGLYIFEYIYFKTFLRVLLLCWLIFIFILNNYIFPISWDFFFNFQNYLSFQNVTFYFEVKLKEYLIFYKSIYYLSHLICQTIILFFIVLDLFKTSLSIVKKLRKLFYFIFFFFSTVITPPEVVYQLIVGVCLIIIYEIITLYLIIKIELVNFT